MHDLTKPRLFLALSRIDTLSPSLLSAMSHDEHQKAERLANPRRRAEYVWGRALLRQLLEKATGLPADTHLISTTDEGKPVCRGGPGVSISHAKGIVASAVALTGDVGIDVEFTDSNRDTKRLATRFFSVGENEWLDTQPANRFYALWVLKEASLKVLGSGLAGGLDRLQCRLEPPSIETAPGFPVACRLTLFELPGAYLGLATTDTQSGEISVSHWDPALDRLTGLSWLQEIASGETRPNPSTS
jgi:4'-phosphopantetheinyl transferase